MSAVSIRDRKAVELADCLVVVLSGNAWITRTRGSGDLILTEGRRKKLHGAGWILQGLPTGCELRYRTWPISRPVPKRRGERR